MLDTNIKVEKQEGKTYPPLPEDVYQVELLDITAKENETYDSRMRNAVDKTFETVLSFQFTLLEGTEGEESLRGRNVWQNFVPTVLYIGKNGKNGLYKIIEALLQRELTPAEEAGGVDGAFLNALIGKQCRIGTKHKASKKDATKIFDNIESYYPIKEELTALNAEEKEEARVKEKDGEAKEPVGLPEQEEIKDSDIPF